ncbi:hypothetical protein AXF41_10060 [Clostridium haemolyticum]|uniref:hypothetical protein n=1 Tax=Clostridium haemolyticum TaxID=84025 RepID=UPI0009C90B32|nr:hypothetical protein [Clostridium haemolyticum]OOB75110.1 hypothetical protein AXF41_10060 [Clostridium haemolyticum]
MNKTVYKIIKENLYNKNLKKYSRKYFYNNNSYHSQINNKQDIKSILERIENLIKYYDNFQYDLIEEDIITLEKELGQYEIAIHKVLQCYDILEFDYTADELEQLINNINLFEQKINKIILKKAMQD